MSKIYELTAQYMNIVELLDDETVPFEVISTALQVIEDDLTVKADNIAKIDAAMAGDEKAIDAEIKRLDARRKAIKNYRTNLKLFLKLQLEAAGITKLKGDIFSINIQNSPPALDIYDPEKVPAQYHTLIPAHWEIQWDKLKDDLKAGEVVPGARLTIGSNLRIR